MSFIKVFKAAVFLVIPLLSACHDDNYIPATEWLYFEIVSEDTLHFTKIYVADGPVVYTDTQYVYRPADNGLNEYSSFRLPLSPFSDSLYFVFEQQERMDTIKISYRQGPEFINRRTGLVYLFQDPEVTYTTFDSLIICEECYRVQ